MAFLGYTDSKYKVAVDQVILGYNTSLQVQGDMKEDQLTRRTHGIFCRPLSQN